MYISELTISNYKGFGRAQTIYFSKGINVLIGSNNSGKTTVIESLRLIFDNKMNKSLHADDFNKNIKIKDLLKKPPEIIISAKLKESNDEEQYSDDLVTVSTWLSKIEKPYEAIITYKFFLPTKEYELYANTVESIDKDDINEYWEMLEYNFIRKYKWKLFAGNIEYENTVDMETLDKFDFQFVDAIRDVERDLFTGKNALLKEVIDFFMDYDIKIDKDKDLNERQREILNLKKNFSTDSNKLIDSLQKRMEKGKAEMLKYVEHTGANDGNRKPGFDGKILDTELYSALRLIIEDETGVKFPITQNGLGYNNLIYISLLLSKMQKNASEDYLGSNSKVYSILAIEEPESHLHPNMQYKFLKFLDKNRSKEVRQIFITSHSSNITAAVNLDDIIILGTDDKHNITLAYPGKVFDIDNDEDNKSKEYVKRFIDVTKADMFFAKKIILVEGIAEQLLVPEFAKLLNLDLIDNYISVINVGGRYFKHFLKLFDKEKSEFAIDKKVVCITDLDPTRKSKEKDGEDKKGNEACLPLFLYCNEDEYEYNECSNELVNQYKDSPNIRIYSQEKGKSCTFEYDIILHNPTFREIVTHSVSNKDEIINMMCGLANKKSPIEIYAMMKGKSKLKEELELNIKNTKFEGEELSKQIIAARYLKSIKKGEVAQELVSVISSEILKEKSDFQVPSYIRKAIQWIYQ